MINTGFKLLLFLLATATIGFVLWVVAWFLVALSYFFEILVSV